MIFFSSLTLREPLNRIPAFPLSLREVQPPLPECEALLADPRAPIPRVRCLPLPPTLPVGPVVSPEIVTFLSPLDLIRGTRSHDSLPAFVLADPLPVLREIYPRFLALQEDGALWPRALPWGSISRDPVPRDETPVTPWCQCDLYAMFHKDNPSDTFSPEPKVGKNPVPAPLQPAVRRIHGIVSAASNGTLAPGVVGGYEAPFRFPPKPGPRIPDTPDVFLQMVNDNKDLWELWGAVHSPSLLLSPYFQPSLRSWFLTRNPEPLFYHGLPV